MTEQLSEFYELMDQKIQQTWFSTEPNDHLSALAKGLQALCKKAVDIGDKAEANLATEGITLADTCDGTIIHYDWLREVKGVLVLWRDVVFQYQKASILQREGQVTQEQVDQLFSESRKRVEAASNHIKEFFDKSKSTLKDETSQNDYLEKQSLKISPWPVYNEQLETLNEQSQLLIEQHGQVVKTKEDLLKLESSIQDVVNSFKIEIERIRELGHQTINIVNENIEEHPQKIVKHIDTIDQQVLAANIYNAYTFIADQITSDMVESMEVPTKIENSQIQYKEINFSNVTRHWLEGEVQPSIIEAQEILDSVGNSMKMALVNVRNRIALATSDGQETTQINLESAELTQPINTALEIINGRLESLKEFQDVVKLRLDEHLHINHVYDEDHSFLHASQQYLVGQINLEQTAWIQKIKNWVFGKSQILKGFMAGVAEEESLSSAEKIVRFVQSRSVHDDNNQYNNIFSAHGYIGESFWVGRNRELSHMIQLIKNWRDGFRGSVIVSGKRFSGKSVYGELIAHRYFPQETIRIRPQGVINIDGRTFETTEDLGPALDFLKKNSINQSYLVWIDDLELWQSPTITASQNVQTLLRHIDDLSAQHFFMVSMSNWFKNHYNQMFKLEKVFQAEINMDIMSEDEVRQAIIIRHGATHKLLVDESGEQVPPQAFAKMVQRVCSLGNYNIGQALNLWSYYTERVNDEQVVHRPDLTYQLPDFINDENSILLRAILMNKRTNEYRLRKILGQSFTTKYKAIVQRLINLGVLNRHIDGLLELNDGIVNDVAALLEQAGYIKYRHR